MFSAFSNYIYQNIDSLAVCAVLLCRFIYTFGTLLCQFILWLSSERKTTDFFRSPSSSRLNHSRQKHLWWTNFNLTLSSFHWFSFCFALLKQQLLWSLSPWTSNLVQRFTLFYGKIPQFITSMVRACMHVCMCVCVIYVKAHQYANQIKSNQLYQIHIKSSCHKNKRCWPRFVYTICMFRIPESQNELIVSKSVVFVSKCLVEV